MIVDCWEGFSSVSPSARSSAIVAPGAPIAFCHAALGPVCGRLRLAVQTGNMTTLERFTWLQRQTIIATCGKKSSQRRSWTAGRARNYSKCQANADCSARHGTCAWRLHQRSAGCSSVSKLAYSYWHGVRSHKLRFLHVCLRCS